jgi:tripartite-type tricarboxylate transporter receptor subunit TctC
MKPVIGAAFAAALACLSFAGHDAHAQSWPSRPIKIIVPTGPGAATDVMARLMADSVSHGLGQPAVVENQPGASGLIAHQNAARSAPDGYTFLFTNTSGLATNPVSFKSLPYNPARDFTPVAMIVDFGPQILSVNAEVPVKSLPELIAYAKANPGKLSYAVDVTAGAAPIIARLFNKRAGKIRRLAISSSQRFPPLPELPAINETVPGVTMDGWFVLVGPAGLPADIVQRMNREVGEFLKGDAIKERLAGFGLATSGAGTPQSTGKFITREQEKWRALAQELNIEPQ